jgi:hypothetical protein
VAKYWTSTKQHIHIEYQKGFTLTTVSVQAEVTLMNVVPFAKHTYLNVARVMATLLVWYEYCLGVQECFATGYQTRQISSDPHRRNSSGVKSGEYGGHSTDLLGLNHHPDKNLPNHSHTLQLKHGGAPSCRKTEGMTQGPLCLNKVATYSFGGDGNDISFSRKTGLITALPWMP